MMNRPAVESEPQPITITYSRSKNLINLPIKNEKTQNSVETTNEAEITLQKLKETLMTMVDIDKPNRSSKREIILIIHIFVWLITFIALAVGFSSYKSSLRFV